MRRPSRSTSASTTSGAVASGAPARSPSSGARATDGRGLTATGSPFADLDWKGRTLVTSQCNNLYVFPGVGLGALFTGFVVLALFVPLIISSGGNSGGQATTLVIRAMALGEVKLRDWRRVLMRRPWGWRR